MALEDLDARAIAVLAVGWAVVGLIGAIVFAFVMAPAIGGTFVVDLWGRGRAASLETDTDVFAVVQLACAVVALIASVLAAVVARRAAPFSVCIGALVSILTPLLMGVVIVNAVVPSYSDLDRAGLASLGMLGGTILGAVSFSLVVVCTRRRDTQAKA
ncbi:hypothetical protein [Agreia sp. Leaf283]|uniref:hypothetical protein n=1 Tax=Agreia sp. Leaf283 TaxID=1736321 RepID=UPI0006F29BCC|nr:hypothetical protein [Agreia sp. Leaf283]KQP56075.1 hypothetical protein ASF51_13205 [Agreia sp. Leaf283]